MAERAGGYEQPETDWRQRAECRQDPELFFPDMMDVAGTEAAKAICRRCAVIVDCRAAVDRWQPEYGVWADEGELVRRVRFQADIEPSGITEQLNADCGNAIARLLGDSTRAERAPLLAANQAGDLIREVSHIVRIAEMADVPAVARFAVGQWQGRGGKQAAYHAKRHAIALSEAILHPDFNYSLWCKRNDASIPKNYLTFLARLHEGITPSATLDELRQQACRRYEALASWASDSDKNRAAVVSIADLYGLYGRSKTLERAAREQGMNVAELRAVIDQVLRQSDSHVQGRAS